MSFICFSTVDCTDIRKLVPEKAEQTDLARLSSPEQEHLYFVLGHQAVAFELVLNLVIACPVVSVLSPSTARHSRAFASSSIAVDWTQPMAEEGERVDG
jgi:hypothetical protein